MNRYVLPLILLLLIGCQPKSAFNDLDGAFSHFRQEKHVAFQNTAMKFGEPLSRELLVDVLQFEESELPGVGEEAHPKGAFSIGQVDYFIYVLAKGKFVQHLNVCSFHRNSIDTFISNVELLNLEQDTSLIFDYFIEGSSIRVIQEKGGDKKRESKFSLLSGRVKLIPSVLPDSIFLEKDNGSISRFFTDYQTKGIISKSKKDTFYIEGKFLKTFGGKGVSNSLFVLSRNTFSTHRYAACRGYEHDVFCHEKAQLLLLKDDSLKVEDWSLGPTEVPLNKPDTLPFKVCISH
jgi:hypothetical protein